MKKLLFVAGLMTLFLRPAYGDTVVIYSTNTNQCLRYLPSQDPTPYLTRIDALIFNDLTTQPEAEVQVLFSTTPVRYIKKVGNPQVAEMTPAEKAQVDAAILLARITATRASSITNLVNLTSQSLLIRAVAGVAVDEINILRKWDRDLKVAVAAATTLAQLKTNIAALPTLNDRTLTEFKNAIIVKINSGAAD